jgi:hypothetical protein
LSLIFSFVARSCPSGITHLLFAFPAGDLVIFGSRTVHRSGPNPTGRRRAAIFGTYHFEAEQPDMRERYWAHRRIYFPPDHGTLLLSFSPPSPLSQLYEDHVLMQLWKI